MQLCAPTATQLPNILSQQKRLVSATGKKLHYRCCFFSRWTYDAKYAVKKRLDFISAHLPAKDARYVIKSKSAASQHYWFKVVAYDAFDKFPTSAFHINSNSRVKGCQSTSQEKKFEPLLEFFFYGPTRLYLWSLFNNNWIIRERLLFLFLKMLKILTQLKIRLLFGTYTFHSRALPTELTMFSVCSRMERILVNSVIVCDGERYWYVMSLLN